jgi:hypothetical protein
VVAQTTCTFAGLQDRTVGRRVFEQCRGRTSRLRGIWADGGIGVVWSAGVRRTRRWVLQQRGIHSAGSADMMHQRLARHRCISGWLATADHFSHRSLTYASTIRPGVARARVGRASAALECR